MGRLGTGPGRRWGARSKEGGKDKWQGKKLGIRRGGGAAPQKGINTQDAKSNEQKVYAAGWF